MIGEPQLRFPEWLERSGLPAHLAEQAKSPAAWLLFRRLVEEDLRQNPGKPGPFEISLDEQPRGLGRDAREARQLVEADLEGAGQAAQGRRAALLPAGDRRGGRALRVP